MAPLPVSTIHSDPNSFDHWFSSSAQQERYFREADDLWDDREDWAKETLTEVSKESSQETLVPARTPSDIDTFYDCTKEDVKARVSQLDAQVTLEENLATQSGAALHGANKRLSQWRLERRSGTGRSMTTGLQGFLVTFSDFLESFSGIVEIVKGADQQYGGLAYGTLSVLLSVAVHKDQREEGIGEALEELTYAFPRLQILKSLQPSARLQELIADVFGLVIKFAKETATYFASRTRRLKEALSPQRQKMRTMSRIRRQLHQVKAESDTLLLQDISDMKQKIDRMSSVIQATQTIAKRTESVAMAHRSSADVEYLAGMRRSLGVQVGALSLDLDKYKALLGRAFTSRRAAIRKPCETTLGSLAEEPIFTEWLQSEDSRLLLVGGQNWHKYDTRDLNWLSEGSVLLIEHLIDQKDEHHGVAWFLCQTDWTMTSRKKHTIQDLISSLTYQMVEIHPDKLRGYQDEIHKSATSGEWKSEDVETALEAFAKLLIGMLRQFDSNSTLSVVIDRLDQCKWSDADEPGWSMRFAIDTFLEVVEKAECCVKIMIIVDVASAKALSRYTARKKLMMKSEWQQKMH